MSLQYDTGQNSVKMTVRGAYDATINKGLLVQTSRSIGPTIHFCSTSAYKTLFKIQENLCKLE